MSDDGGLGLVVVRCLDCGDTFPIHEGDDATCPSCGGDRVEPAHEPLL
jgi:rRNA maturation endonuclease Nob1